MYHLSTSTAVQKQISLQKKDIFFWQKKDIFFAVKFADSFIYQPLLPYELSTVFNSM